MYYIIKILSSAMLIVLISEIAKRSSFWGAILASLPFISIIAFVFLYVETKDPKQVADLSTGIFWLVIPSLALFISLPYLIKKGLDFPIALFISCGLTVVMYFLMTLLLKKFNIEI